MRFVKQIGAAAGATLTAVALSVATAPAADAAPVGPTLSAAPVSVYQIPALGVQVSGLAIPGPLLASVHASAPAPGLTTFSAPASRETCSTTAAGALVQIDYVNVGTGARGSSTVKPCPYYLHPAPTHQTVNTGSGPVVFTVSIKGSYAYPNAGQPSLPGVGGFVAP
jgi:hypothetical protein